MRVFSLLILAVLGIAGCNDAGTPTENGPSGTIAPDNTGVNERDRSSTAKTPIDQNENQSDIDITASIRKQVVDTQMSVDAQNVKIITQDGKVTLRGPVANADEKKRIEDIAHKVAGVDKVDSQLEVK
jgi:osmotically-inducible protein OsmY